MKTNKNAEFGKLKLEFEYAKEQKLNVNKLRQYYYPQSYNYFEIDFLKLLRSMI